MIARLRPCAVLCCSLVLLAGTVARPAAAEDGEEPAAKTPAECIELIQARYLDERRAGVAGIAALGDAAKQQIVGKLMPLLDAENWQTQLHAAKALQRIGELAKGSVPDLLGKMKTALEHKDPGLFDLLGRTVAQLKGRDPRDLKAMFTMMKTAMSEGNTDQYDKLSATLGAKGKEAVPTLVEMVQESEGMLRKQAVSSLAGLGEQASGAVEALLAVGAETETAMQRHIQEAIEAIKAENRPPVVAACEAGCNEGKSTEIELAMTDPDDLPLVLRAEIAEKPEHGSLERRSALVFVYTSKPGFKGEDVFTWQGSDGQGTSEPVTCTVDVHPDTEGPRIAAAAGNGTAKILVTFNEQVTEASAARPEAYSVDQGVTVSGASLTEDGTGVVLETSALADGTDYTVSASGIADRSEAHNTADSSRTFTYQAAVPGLVYRYYETKDFDALKADPAATAPTTTGTAPAFGKKPAERESNYALDFSGNVRIATAGEYTFFTASDDGSHLWIDGQMVVDNGGMHGVEEKSGKVELTAGLHAIRVFFYQGSGGHDLFVRWQPPGGEKEEIPAEVLSHLPGAE